MTCFYLNHQHGFAVGAVLLGAGRGCKLSGEGVERSYTLVLPYSGYETQEYKRESGRMLVTTSHVFCEHNMSRVMLA